MTFQAYPEYKDSGVEWLGEVPALWVLTPIKHLALLNPRKSDFDGDTEQLCSFVPMEKLKTGVVQLDEERPIGEVIGGYTYFEDGDVLQAKVTPCFENKNVAIAKRLTNGIGFGSSEINVLRPYKGVSAEYLYYRVQEDTYMSFCTSSMIGAGGLKRVPTDVINNFTVAAPKLFEQAQIARFLNYETARIDTLIEEQQHLIGLLKEKRQAVISHTVTKGLDPTASMKDSGVDWLGEVPAHWVVNRAKLVSDIFVPQRNKPELNDSEGIAWVTMEDMNGGYISATSLKVTEHAANEAGSKVLKKGAVIASCVGRFGVVAINSIDVIINQQLQAFEPRKIKAEYLRNIVSLSKEYFELIGTAATLVYVNQQGFENLPVLIPPVSEQESICLHVDEANAQFDALLSQSFKSIQLLQERRSALISATVTGKIDVRGWQPPASAPFPELEKEAV